MERKGEWRKRESAGELGERLREREGRDGDTHRDRETENVGWLWWGGGGGQRAEERE